MRYKRQESLRFQFGNPLEAQFKITKINDKKIDSKPGKALIHDMSRGGLNISTNFNLYCEENKIEVEISFVLVSNKSFPGEIIWKKKKKDYFYGVKLLIDDAMSNELINELKIYSQNEKKQ
ncbi:PilZ domain-containing protein [Aquibacillus halophilus]|uniref:PilZ domain-containing protein n=1 Tax=Aquibacillus halophilus TaxID=930132 RepID=A0A6A8DH45_9BACI|nr:PilZ domain-containing protein [Aquibacillus halophilus]MRH45018.1 PilZ domain-containing protein [Aquibacillus halophilus]